MNAFSNENILLTKYQGVPFLKIKNSDFIPAVKHYIDETNREINEIVQSRDSPTFINTIRKLELSTKNLDQTFNLLNNKNRCYTDSETQALCKEASELMTIFKNSLFTNSELFVKIEKVLKHSINDENLDNEEKTILQRKFYSFVRNGARINKEDKERLCEINLEISKLILTFEENLLAEKKAYFFEITKEEDLKGLPENDKKLSRALAEKKGLPGWVFTFDMPSYLPFITYIENRDLRRKLTTDYSSRANLDNENDNKNIVLTVTKLRKERALLLGYKSHADFVLSDRMAETPEKVFDFLRDINEKAVPKAEKEIKLLADFAREFDGTTDLSKWDHAYYSEKLKKKLYDIDQELIKPYLKLENVIEGAFSVASQLYNISFTEVNYLEKFSKEIKTYEVKNEKNEIFAYFYGDFFPRDDKQNGGWVYTFKPQCYDFEEKINQIPYVGIFCNFPKPSEDKPALLTFDNVTTLFHEFGHALHSMFSEVKYPSLSNINVLWDFVELPSQIMENFCYEEEILSKFAKHYQNDEIIPYEYVKKIKESKNFMNGVQTVRQTNFSTIDMKWHGVDFPLTKEEIKKFEADTLIEFYPSLPNSLVSVSFLHLFNSTYDYSAGYYSYHWAEVLDKDAFEVFKEKGILNKEVSSLFRNNILKKGGSEHPSSLYRKFKGKDPSTEAFFREKELI